MPPNIVGLLARISLEDAGGGTDAEKPQIDKGGPDAG